MRRCLVVIALLLTFSSVAIGQPKGPNSQKAVSEAIKGHLDKSEYEEALALAQNGYQTYKSAELLAYVCYSLYNLHRYQEFETSAKEYLSKFPKGKDKKDLNDILQKIPAILQTKISVKSEPTGAKVWLDTKTEAPLGDAPFEINALPGRHTLLAELEGYDRAELNVDIIQNATTPFTITLNEAKSKVTIESEPAGAQVLIDGKEAGVTPFEGKVTPGKHTIKVQKEGYGFLKYEAEARLGKPISFKDKLPPPFAVLALSSPSPIKDLEVTVDGKKVEALPAELTLEGGDHKISAKAPGYRSFEKTVNIPPGKEAEVPLDLRPQGLYLTVKPDLPGAKLIADGKEAPQEVVFVPLGQTSNIQVTMPGRLPYQETFTASEDQNLTAAIEMREPKVRRAFIAFGIGAVVAGAGEAVFGTMAKNKLEVYNDPDNTPTKSQFDEIVLMTRLADGSAAAAILLSGGIGVSIALKERKGKIGESKATVSPTQEATPAK